MWQGILWLIGRCRNHWKCTKSYRLIGYLLEHSIECLEGCRFARYCFTKSTYFISSPLVTRRQKMLYYVVIRLGICFLGYDVSEQYKRSTVFCTSSRAQKKYSSNRDSARLRVLDLTSQGD